MNDLSDFYHCLRSYLPETQKKESYLNPSFLILQTSFAQEKPNVPFEQVAACN